MSYADITRNNKSSIKKFSHQKRFRVAMKLIDLKPQERLLDFGTGDGFLLQCIHAENSKAKLVGFDPLDFMFQELKETIEKNQLEQIQITNNLTDLGSKSFDVVSCLEVLEHFSETEQKRRLLEVKNQVKDEGRIIVSVPLETGFPSLLKNSVRFLIGQNKEEASFKNIIKSFLSLNIERQREGYIYTHIGFDHKKLETVFKTCDLKICKKEFSPFKYFYGIINSQVFYILKKQ
ncbi:class I SAM-dependent methyltransferase [Xanthomarina sp. F2636L]|uniref:class I SAM-dependent methyltransferase n=1 Tax=Xanthomarina sp. F2636L TaxID=2996018 RepID=UPI00225E0E57|nr:methyltransferase domain-containing protein [Xanthomarina sp. F2636L]MCX7551864.1 methyltransferase domain-containing protein [Xanthomarina sp. F2636L]